MGKSIDNEYADGFSGKIGRNMVFRQTKSGEVIVAKKPRKSKIKPDAKKLAARKKFKKAALYAGKVEADPETKALYAAATKGLQSAFNLALRDARKAPVVNSIDTSLYKGEVGNTLIIDAEDDFKVVAVKVSIYAADGSLLEEGNATQPELEVDWIYTTTVVNDQLAGTTITVKATDLPGNKGLLEITL